MWDMSHSYARHDSFMYATWLTYTETFVGWLIHMWDMSHSYVRHDSFICEKWLIHIRDTTHLYQWFESFTCVYASQEGVLLPPRPSWDDSFICETWLIHICDMTHLYQWHESFICVYASQEGVLLPSRPVWHENYRSLLQNIVSFIGLFCQRDLLFQRLTAFETCVAW